MHFGSTCRWGSAQGAWIIGELEWFRLEDSFLLWGCGTFVSPLQLLAEVDSGRSFKLAWLLFIGKGASGVEVVLCACCQMWKPQGPCETGSHCAYLCTSTLHRADPERPSETLTIWADGRSGQWNDRNCSHGGAGGFPFIFWIRVGLIKITHGGKKHDWVMLLRCQAPQ